MRRLPSAPSRRRTLLIFLTALSLALPSLAVTPRTSADELSDARAQQRALQTKIKAQQSAVAQLKADEGQLQTAIAATNSQLSSINVDQATLQGQIATASAALAKARTQYDGLVRQLDQLDWTLGILQGELDDRQADLAGRKRLLAARLAEAYQTQQTSLLEQILSADSLTAVLADVGDYLSLGDQDAQLAQQIQEDQAGLLSLQKGTDQTRFVTDQLAVQVAQQSAGLARQEAALVTAKKQLDALQQQTAALLAQQKAAYDRTYRTRAAAAAALAQEQAEERNVSQKISDLLAANANSWNIPSSSTARSSGRCAASSPRSSAAPASTPSHPGPARRTATVPTSIAASTSPRPTAPRSAPRARGPWSTWATPWTSGAPGSWSSLTVGTSSPSTPTCSPGAPPGSTPEPMWRRARSSAGRAARGTAPAPTSIGPSIEGRRSAGCRSTLACTSERRRSLPGPPWPAV